MLEGQSLLASRLPSLPLVGVVICMPQDFRSGPDGGAEKPMS